MYVLLTISTVTLVLVVILLIRQKCKGESYRKLGNPGCDVGKQVECTKAGMSGTCDSNPNCCSCSDWEGEGCVPKSCASTACVNGSCGT